MPGVNYRKDTHKKMSMTTCFTSKEASQNIKKYICNTHKIVSESCFKP